MTFARQYLDFHKALYIKEEKKKGYSSFSSCHNWTDHIIDDNMVFSHRTNSYTKKTFTEGLHVHRYYELIIYMAGNVEYIKDNYSIKPKPCSAVWFLPGQMHTATLLSPSSYERYVFYFTEDFFTLNNSHIPMTAFMKSGDANIFYPESDAASELKKLSEKIEDALSSPLPYGGLLAKALIIELFSVLTGSEMSHSDLPELNDPMMEVKNYIDKEYSSISTSFDISEKFHYSREHLSRKFKDRFNITISDYISKRRILESLPLLMCMPGAEVSYAVGFKSQSAFISAFRKNMGCLPSEYKKQMEYQR